MRVIRCLAVAALLAGAGCGDPAAPAVAGEWGGPQATLIISPSGGSVEYACGAGSIDRGWTLTGDGHWSATGQHMTGGGPAPIEGRPPHAATYAGRFAGDLLTFSVTVPDLGTVLGPFEVRRDAPGASEICL